MILFDKEGDLKMPKFEYECPKCENSFEIKVDFEPGFCGSMEEPPQEPFFYVDQDLPEFCPRCEFRWHLEEVEKSAAAFYNKEAAEER